MHHWPHALERRRLPSNMSWVFHTIANLHTYLYLISISKYIYIYTFALEKVVYILSFWGNLPNSVATLKGSYGHS